MTIAWSACVKQSEFVLSEDLQKHRSTKESFAPPKSPWATSWPRGGCWTMRKWTVDGVQSTGTRAPTQWSTHTFKPQAQQATWILNFQCRMGLKVLGMQLVQGNQNQAMCQGALLLGPSRIQIIFNHFQSGSIIFNVDGPSTTVLWSEHEVFVSGSFCGEGWSGTLWPHGQGCVARFCSLRVHLTGFVAGFEDVWSISTLKPNRTRLESMLYYLYLSIQ